MARTTIDLDTPILRELKRLQRKRGSSLGRLVSDLLAKALALEAERPTSNPFQWKSHNMGVPRVDLRDKDALWSILDAGKDDSNPG